MNWKPFDSLTTHSAFRRYCHPGHSSWCRHIVAARICNSLTRDIGSGRWTRRAATASTPVLRQHPELQSIQCGSPVSGYLAFMACRKSNLMSAHLCTDCFISARETYSSRLSLCYVLPMFVERLLATHFNRRQIGVGQEPKAQSSSGTTSSCNQRTLMSPSWVVNIN